MADRWLRTTFRDAGFKNPKTHNVYFNALRHGLDSSGAIDPVRMRATIEDYSQPVSAQRMLATLLRLRPDLSTPELTEILELPLVDVKRKSKPLPKMDDILEWRDTALEVISAPKNTVKRYAVSDKRLRAQALLVWTITEFALAGAPLRNSEFASIRVNDPDAPNNLDVETETLTIRESKNGTERFYDLDGLANAWKDLAVSVFGEVPGSLMTKYTGEPYTDEAFASEIKRINPQLGSQRIRKVIATDSILHATPEEDAELASRMEHSAGVHGTTYFAPDA